MVHTTGERQGGPRLEHQRSIYSAPLKANMPIFDVGRHFIEPFRRETASQAGLWCETMAETISQRRFAG
jgi:hypothetical protein